MRIALTVTALALIALPPKAVKAENDGDRPITIGATLTVGNLADAVIGAGFPVQVSPGKDSEPVLGRISATMGDAKFEVIVNKCPEKSDEICGVNLVATVGDAKKALSDAAVDYLNSKTTMAKVSRSSQKNLLTVSYQYPCRYAADARFMGPVVQDFSKDLGRVTTEYNYGSIAH